MVFFLLPGFASPLTDLQAEIRGLAGTNILNNQLQTEQVETRTIQAAVKESGAIDITLEDVEQTNGNLLENMGGKRRDTEYVMEAHKLRYLHFQSSRSRCANH